MSRKTGIDTIFLRPTPRLTHTDYSMSCHMAFVRRVTGLAPDVRENTTERHPTNAQ